MIVKRKTTKRKKNVTKDQVRDMIKSSTDKIPHKVVYGTNIYSQDNNMSWFSTPLPVVGTGYNQRLGDSIEVISLTMRYTAYYGDAGNVIRLVAFQFNGVQSSAPPSSGLFLPGPSTAVDFMSPKKFLQKNLRYHCLFDKTITVCSGGSNAVVTKEFKVPLKATRWNFDLGSVSSLIGNQVWFALISDSAVVPHPTFDYVLEVRYRDV